MALFACINIPGLDTRGKEHGVLYKIVAALVHSEMHYIFIHEEV